MAYATPLQEKSASNFVKLCKTKFGWSDLKEDVVMDVGCGSNMACCKALLQQYPDVRIIIAIDKDPQVIGSFRGSPWRKMEFAVADIEKRDTLSHYLGKMTKVVSTFVFHELTDIQTAFQNVYDLLRPGGEAGLHFFTQSSTHEFFLEMVKIKKWKDVYQDCFNTDSFLNGMEKSVYLEMVGKVGFKVVDCSGKTFEKPYVSDKECVDVLSNGFKRAFKVPSELLQEFKDDILKVFEKVAGRDGQGRLVYKSAEMDLLLLKPKEASAS